MNRLSPLGSVGPGLRAWQAEGDIPCVVHAQRVEQLGADQLLERPFRRHLGQPSRHVETHGAIVKLGPRLGRQAPLGQRAHRLGQRPVPPVEELAAAFFMSSSVLLGEVGCVGLARHASAAA